MDRDGVRDKAVNAVQHRVAAPVLGVRVFAKASAEGSMQTGVKNASTRTKMGGVRSAASRILALEGLSARTSPQALSMLSQLLQTLQLLAQAVALLELSILSQLLPRFWRLAPL